MIILKFFLLFTLTFSAATCAKINKKIEPLIIVHGGAGTMPMSTEVKEGKSEAVRLAVEIGYKTLMQNGSVLDAVEQAVRQMESDVRLNCGYGSTLAQGGGVEMDACIMNGADQNFGSVSNLKNILHPISVARMVMEISNHSFLVGNGAMEFAIRRGVEILPEGALVTENSKKALNFFHEIMANETLKNNFHWSQFSFVEPGTVGAVAIDADGNIAAAASTGGLTGKARGRVGDSPVIGAGTLAVNKIVGVTSSGDGEYFMRISLANRIRSYIEFLGYSAQQAAERAINELSDRFNTDGGSIVIDGNGDVGVHTTSHQFVWVYRKGNELHHGVDAGEHIVDTVE